jgi:hypothetical protein
LKEIVINWFCRSQDNTFPSVFDRFISLWIAFEAWATNESNSVNSREIINWVKRSPMKDIFERDNQKIKSYLNDLHKIGEIRNHRGRPKRYDNINDFSQLIEVIYQIRNNLFHGHKSPTDKEDERIVTLAYNILSQLFKPFVDELRCKAVE